MKGGRSAIRIDSNQYSDTGLSPYIKFGCISIREVLKIYNYNENIIRNLLWKDFYAC